MHVKIQINSMQYVGVDGCMGGIQTRTHVWECEGMDMHRMNAWMDAKANHKWVSTW